MTKLEIIALNRVLELLNEYNSYKIYSHVNDILPIEESQQKQRILNFFETILHEQSKKVDESICWINSILDQK